MKKLMIALGAAASMAWCANAAESKVSGIDFDLLTAGNTLSIGPEGGRYYWETAATEISSTIKACDENDATKGNYLAVDETVPLYRTMNGSLDTVTPATGTSLAENGVYFKSDVQFTASDETSGEGMVAEGDKLLVWLRATEAVEAVMDGNTVVTPAVPATTNLIITAMNADGTGSADYVVANSGEGGINIDPATWYTLTIKAKQTGGAGEETAEFEVYVGDTKLASGQKTSFTSLVAAGGSTSATITSVGFKGTGALDNLEFGTFTEVVPKFTLTVNVTDNDSLADSVTVDDKPYTDPIPYDVGYNSDVVIRVTDSEDKIDVVSTVGSAQYDESGFWEVTIPAATLAAVEADGNLIVAITVVPEGAAPTYNVTISGGANATVTTAPETITGLANGATVTITATPNQGYTYTGVDYTGWTLSGTAITKTVTIANDNVSVVVPAAVSATTPATWPSAWTEESKGYSEAYATKLSDWAKDNDVTDVSALSAEAEAAFLLNIAPDAADKTLKVASIVIEDGKVKITTSPASTGVNGKVYLYKGDSPTSLTKQAEAIDGGDLTTIPYDTNKGEQFYKVEVGY